MKESVVTDRIMQISKDRGRQISKTEILARGNLRVTDDASKKEN